MFYTHFTTGSGTATLDMAKSQSCHLLISRHDCSTSTNLNLIIVYDYNADDENGNINTIQDNLKNMCIHKYQIGSVSIFTDTYAAACRKIFGCPG
jgi:hypothetical protein